MKTLAALLLFPFFLSGQNLLMNPGFEDENICLEYQKNCAPEGWISTSLYADYYFDDSAHAFKGRHFTGLVIANKARPGLRHFLRTRLLCGLRKGAQYRLQFRLRSTHRAFDSIGIYFSAVDLLYQKDRLAAARPQLFINEAKNLRPTEAWQTVLLLYTATGDEVFFNIGDFNPRGHNLAGDVPDLQGNAYFFLDDFSLTPVNPLETLCDDADKTGEEEYTFDARHGKLDRLIYVYTKNPPPVELPTKTAVRRIDTLVIPDVLFATASFALNKAANNVLDSFVRQAATRRVDSVVVEGHTDNQGVLSANQRLSENRAATVAAYLQPRLPKAIITRGWASNKPVADNRSPEGRQKNRRVEIYFYVRE